MTPDRLTKRKATKKAADAHARWLTEHRALSNEELTKRLLGFVRGYSDVMRLPAHLWSALEVDTARHHKWAIINILDILEHRTPGGASAVRPKPQTPEDRAALARYIGGE